MSLNVRKIWFRLKMAKFWYKNCLCAIFDSIYMKMLDLNLTRWNENTNGRKTTQFCHCKNVRWRKKKIERQLVTYGIKMHAFHTRACVMNFKWQFGQRAKGVIELVCTLWQLIDISNLHKNANDTCFDQFFYFSHNEQMFT